jgi:hypothetical protein
MKRNLWRWRLFGVLAITVAACVFMWWRPVPVPPVGKGPGPGPDVVSIEKTERFPVRGSDGYVLLVDPDGSVYVDGPEGKRLLLPPTPAAKEVKGKKEETAPVRRPLGRFAVLDKGLVELPAEGVVVFTGPDHVVVASMDGLATAYFTDGRAEVRGRGDLKGAKP